jgi:hypothetical protein
MLSCFGEAGNCRREVALAPQQAPAAERPRAISRGMLIVV